MTSVVDFFVPVDAEEADAEDTDESVGVLIENLQPREQLVLTLRFGLKGKEQQTLVQVSRVLGVSKKRVRQIERGRSRNSGMAPFVPAVTWCKLRSGSIWPRTGTAHG